MKFKVIEQNSVRKLIGNPKLRFTHQGFVSINGAGVHKLKLPENAHIIIVQDEEKPNDFYLIITEDKKFPRLRKVAGRSRIASYGSAYHILCNHFNLPPKINFDLGIGGQIKSELGTAHCLITSKLLELSKEVNHV
ncbi:hypothetical protein V8V91_08670 [Algoriphagus halophilus]|uniref:hypothetical protein n=1 Tax=Algoriphagus halophilus TaxID=226505 RepID=UPI0035900225